MNRELELNGAIRVPLFGMKGDKPMMAHQRTCLTVVNRKHVRQSAEISRVDEPVNGPFRSPYSAIHVAGAGHAGQYLPKANYGSNHLDLCNIRVV